jgi:hypothetical protein
MNSKKEYVEHLWSTKSTSETILLLCELVDNSSYSKTHKNKVRSVLKGIIAYTDRGTELYDHHREYLQSEWDTMWNAQRNNQVKEDILKFLQK